LATGAAIFHELDRQKNYKKSILIQALFARAEGRFILSFHHACSHAAPIPTVTNFSASLGKQHLKGRAVYTILKREDKTRKMQGSFVIKYRKKI
jgi:hypothetical protein